MPCGAYVVLREMENKLINQICSLSDGNNSGVKESKKEGWQIQDCRERCNFNRAVKNNCIVKATSVSRPKASEEIRHINIQKFKYYGITKLQ